MDSGIPLFLWLLFILLTAFVNIMFAIGVFRDAGSMDEKTGRSTFLVGSFIWTGATLVGGVFVAGVYWLIHYSALNPNVYEEAEKAEQSKTDDLQ